MTYGGGKSTFLDNQLPHPLPDQYGREIFRCQVGSGLYGTNLEGHDDRDEMGMCIEHPDYVIGLRQFEQWQYRTRAEGERSGYGDLDLTVYSLRKWTRLALAGNPTVLMPLFVPESEVVVNTDVGRELREHPDRFLSREVAAKFHGYMVSQRMQMLGLRPGKRHTNRPELIEQYGFDGKSAYHMVRLGLQGVELLTTGRITLPIPEPDRTWLLQLRHGEHTKEEALERAADLEVKLLYLRYHADLPVKPDHGRANLWLIDVYRREWGQPISDLRR